MNLNEMCPNAIALSYDMESFEVYCVYCLDADGDLEMWNNRMDSGGGVDGTLEDALNYDRLVKGMCITQNKGAIRTLLDLDKCSMVAELLK